MSFNSLTQLWQVEGKSLFLFCFIYLKICLTEYVKVHFTEILVGAVRPLFRKNPELYGELAKGQSPKVSYSITSTSASA